MERPIYIPDPCHVSWKKMTPEEEGRHCAVCDKVVVDFSKKNSTEISNYLEKNAGSKVCGRFTVDQLDHDAQMKVFKKPSNLFNKNWKYAVMAFLGIFSIARKTEAQKLRGKVMMPRGDVGYVEKPINPANKTTKIISGHVSADDRAHVQEVIIEVYQNEDVIATATTLANGRFVIKLDPGILKGTKVKLVATHEDYQQEFLSDTELTKDTTKVEINMNVMYMMKGEVVAPPKKYHLQGGVSMTQHLQNYPEPEVLPEDPDSTVTCTKTTMPEDTTLVEPVMVVGKIKIDREEEITPEVQLKDLTEQEEKEYSAIVPLPEDLQELGMNLFPNPAANYVILNVEGVEGFQYEIYDLSGAIVTHGRSNGKQLRLDVSGWTPATYVCIAREGDRARSMKLVISR